jgi:spermidine/putrescine transport system permease protein
VTALLLVPTTAWYLFLLVVPLGILIVFSLGTRTDVGGYSPGLTLQNYADLPTRWPAFQNTLTLALIGTILCALVAYPLAYYLATRAGQKRTVLLILVILPFWTSFLVRTYAWLQILGANGIPSLLQTLGVEPRPVFLNTHAAVLLGIVYNYLPLMVFPLYVSLERLDKRLIEASKDLGANRLRTFFQVTLPLTAPGLVSGALLVFIPMMGEYIIPSILGGGKIYFVGNALVDLYLQSRNWPLGSAAAIGLIALVVLTATVYLRLTRVSSQRDVSLL